MKIVLAIGFFLLTMPLIAQISGRIVFYNTENLYDTRNDSLTLDDDFTPMGKMHWTETKYKDKLLKLSHALSAAGKDTPPILIGLSEIENRWVLEDLIKRSGLAEGDYGIVHQDSPDRRGIDVALLYRKACFRPLVMNFLPVLFPEDTTLLTRDVLYTAGIWGERDTLHVFVCHFPSMYGGEEESEWKRERAAAVVRNCVDSIQHHNPSSAILIMGDLNGKADRVAQTKVLRVNDAGNTPFQDTVLYNTGYYLLNRNEGSYKYRGMWQTIDHIIVSGVMLNGRSGIKAENRLRPFDAPFLLEEEPKYHGYKPFRTYLGPRYNGGYSDHLPVYLELYP